jgi:hypothetical protein
MHGIVICQFESLERIVPILKQTREFAEHMALLQTQASGESG